MNRIDVDVAMVVESRLCPGCRAFSRHDSMGRFHACFFHVNSEIFLLKWLSNLSLGSNDSIKGQSIIFHCSYRLKKQ